MLATLKRLPIGYTKADSPTFIIDEEGKLPNGEQGEIIVSGPAVSKGYMNNPEKRQKPSLSSKVFQPTTHRRCRNYDR